MFGEICFQELPVEISVGVEMCQDCAPRMQSCDHSLKLIWRLWPAYTRSLASPWIKRQTNTYTNNTYSILIGFLYLAASPDGEELSPSGRLSKWLYVKSHASPQPDIRHRATRANPLYNSIIRSGFHFCWLQYLHKSEEEREKKVERDIQTQTSGPQIVTASFRQPYNTAKCLSQGVKLPWILYRNG